MFYFKKIIALDLFQYLILVPVNDECMFKDENIMYRFRKDDGTFPWHEDVAVFLRAQRIFNKLVSIAVNDA